MVIKAIIIIDIIENAIAIVVFNTTKVVTEIWKVKVCVVVTETVVFTVAEVFYRSGAYRGILQPGDYRGVLQVFTGSYIWLQIVTGD